MDITAAAMESPARPRWLGVGLPLLAGGAVAGGLALLHFRDPHVQNSYGVCPFYELTGYWCPAAAALRGLHNLTDGRFLDAIQSNVLILPLTLGFIAWWGTWLVRGFRGSSTPPRLPQVLPKSAMWVALAFLFVFTVVRTRRGGAGSPPFSPGACSGYERFVEVPRAREAGASARGGRAAGSGSGGHPAGLGPRRLDRLDAVAEDDPLIEELAARYLVP
ncbi:DUF2752 domain-containing protein [Nocardia seriolae]|uniref:DUF2752 domain-containing protein n=1 Tax=Nocardia seriolae TaxID=37332 RepID=UPI003CD0A6AE